MKEVKRPNLENLDEMNDWDCDDKASENYEKGYNSCLDEVVPYIEYLEEQLKQVNKRKIMLGEIK